MSFISHAQNREDVLLWRALQHVGGGFYVDVGANHPADDSVTKAFYDRGWCGINIEPLVGHVRELAALRPRDVNLCVAVGPAEGEIELFDTTVRGLATASEAVAMEHHKQGLKVRSTRVPMRKLSAIFEEYAPADVHFLKIDVEGFEKDVLEGMDFVRWRPWIVVVEATRPNSNELAIEWEALVTNHSYRPVFFDGLNRYYLASEHPELAHAFAAPPNVFDGFVAAEQERLRLEVQQLQLELKVNSPELVRRLEQEAHALRNELDAVRRSHSWRVTAPLRVAADIWRRLRTRLRHPEDRLNKAMPVAPAKSVNPCHEHALARVAVAPKAASGPTLPPAFWWRMVGHVEGHYSLAVVNRGLALALDAASGHQVQWVPWHGQRYEPGTDVPPAQLAAVQRLVGQPALEGAPVVSLVHHFPLLVDEAAADIRLFVFFWEESRVPPEMVEHLNDHADGVLVASSFVQRVLRHSGCHKPIFVLPLGLDKDLLQAALPATTPTPSLGKPFRFLHVSSAFERKGLDVLLKAFFERFDDADGVELVIKTFANPHHDVRGLVLDWQTRYPKGPPVCVDLELLDEPAMLALYRSAHAVVLPTRGEGFNLPAAEALALGIPLLVTGGGGQADFATLQTATLLPYRLANSRSHLHTPGSYWMEPDAQDLAEQMVRVKAGVLAHNEALNQQRLTAAQWVREQYRWERSADAAIAAAGAIWAQRQTRAAPQKLLVLSPWQTACGVAEYTQALLADWERAFELEVWCDHRTVRDAFQAVYEPCWTQGDDAQVQALLAGLLDRPPAAKPHVVLVQHQQSLFELTEPICLALQRLRNEGVVVVVELHSTLPLVRERRVSDKAASALRTLDLVVVHKLDDVNYLLGLGLVNNVMCLPHGVTTLPAGAQPFERSDWGLQPDDLVLSCFGFLLPHKGLDAVIGSLPGLALATGRRVKLLAVTAALDERSKTTLAECRALAEKLGVAADVVWATDFLPMQECLHLLALADFQLYVYGPTRESASGAVTVGLATHKPVLVSQQPIFSDLSDCTFQLAGNTATDVVNGVLHLLNDPAATSALCEAQEKWLIERNWGQLSTRLKATVLGLIQDRSGPQSECLPDTPRQRQLLVDVSELVLRDAQTGIQRVVRQILQQWLKNPPAGYVVRAVCALKGQTYQYATRLMAAPGDENLDGMDVEAGLGDIFVGLDLSAHLFPEVEPQLHAWRLAGVRICYVIYDLIPLQMPEATTAGMKEAFDTWLQGLRREANRLVCISRAVAHDVRMWMCGHTPEGALPEISAFHLGAELPVPDQAPCPPTLLPLLEKIKAQPTLLMVGTVEPRKGHNQAIDALELLWERDVNVALVVVGKPGWMVETLCQRMRDHPERGWRLHWLEQADDTVLAQLYRHCTGLLAASTAEGFGLPLIEAAHFGLPIVARALPVFKEVAGDHAFYFEGSDPQALARALDKWLELHGNGQAPSSREMTWQTWETSAAQLLEAVL